MSMKKVNMNRNISATLFIIATSLTAFVPVSAQAKTPYRDQATEIERANTLVTPEDVLEKLRKRSKPDEPFSIYDYDLHLATSDTVDLSPDGKHVLLLEESLKTFNEHGLKNNIQNQDSCFMKTATWLDNQTLAKYCYASGENSTLFAYNINTLKVTPILETPAQSYLGETFPERKTALVYSQVEDGKNFDLYSINWQTGTSKKIFDSGIKKLAGVLIDDEEKVFGYAYQHEGRTLYEYKLDSTFEPTVSIGKIDTFEVMSTKQKGHQYYVKTSVDKDATTLGVFDFKSKKLVKTLSSRPKADIQRIFTNSLGQPILVAYNADHVKHRYDFLVPELQAVFERAKAAVKKQVTHVHRIDFFDSSDDYSSLLVNVRDHSATQSIYWYDDTTKQLKTIHNSYDELSQEMLSPMKPIQFKSRDGVIIHGYLTLPSEKKTVQKPPLIVMPHGGPVGYSDDWLYHAFVQYFAANGYAVLQVNYRVSDGRSKAFQAAAYGKVGTMPIHDIEDGIRSVVENGWVDDEKIVGFGQSYGGFAITRGAILYPHRYQCLASLMGIYDVEAFLFDTPEFWQLAEVDFYNTWNDEYAEKGKQAFRDISPLYDADKLNMPMFIVQGEDDIRVKLYQANDMVEALRKHNNTVYYRTLPLGHDYIDPLTTLDMILGFYDECLNDK